MPVPLPVRGLARDLIRTCRSVIEQAALHPKRSDLPSLGRDLIEMDLAAKLRAVTIAMRKIPMHPEVDRFSASVNEITQAKVNAAFLLRMAKKLYAENLPGKEEGAEGDRLSDEVVAKQDEIRRLRAELAGFLLYCATLLKLFNGRLTQKKLKAAESGGTLNEFSRFRQLLAVTPELARMKMAAYLGETV